MRRIKLILVLIVISCKCFAADSLKVSLFTKELRAFIDTSKKVSPKEGIYNVYVVYFYNINKDSNICFTLGHIYNASRSTYEELAATHFFILDGEYVLVRSDINIDFLSKALIIRKIDRSIEEKIFEKLCPLYDKEGHIFGYIQHTHGLVGCLSDNNVKSLFYINIDEIPRKLSIFKFTIIYLIAPICKQQNQTS